MQGFSDEFAEKTFDLMAIEVAKNAADMPSDMLGRTILPMLAEAAQYGRTRKIRLGALRLTKVVLEALDGREDCNIVAQEHKPGDPMPTQDEMKAALEAGTGAKLLIDAIDKQIQEEERQAKAFEGVSVDQILNAPLHPEAKGR